MPRKVVLKGFGQFLESLRGKKSLKKIEIEAKAHDISLPKSTLQTYEAGRVGALSSNRLRELATVYRIAYETLLNEYVKDRFSADLLNPEYQITPQQQAVFNQLNTENGEYLLKLGWIFAEGQDQHRQVLQNLLDEFSKEAPADALVPPAAVTDLTDPTALAGPKVSATPVLAVEDYLRIPYAPHARIGTASSAVNFDELDDSCCAFHRSIFPQWAHPESLICLRSAGDSMEPTLHDEDLIVLDRSETDPVDGCLVVVRTKEGVVIKRVRRVGRSWQLLSDNPSYPPRQVAKDDRVIGRVAWSGPQMAGAVG